ncbi:secreted protein [gut metagenome]|uniref:Secreted protein n=1 Tax=gut metagenome TaxID=749906 RepID=J9CQZ2_9ZZZZ
MARSMRTSRSCVPSSSPTIRSTPTASAAWTTATSSVQVPSPTAPTPSAAYSRCWRNPLLRYGSATSSCPCFPRAAIRCPRVRS